MTQGSNKKPAGCGESESGTFPAQTVLVPRERYPAISVAIPDGKAAHRAVSEYPGLVPYSAPAISWCEGAMMPLLRHGAPAFRSAAVPQHWKAL